MLGRAGRDIRTSNEIKFADTNDFSTKHMRSTKSDDKIKSFCYKYKPSQIDSLFNFRCLHVRFSEAHTLQRSIKLRNFAYIPVQGFSLMEKEEK